MLARLSGYKILMSAYVRTTRKHKNILDNIYIRSCDRRTFEPEPNGSGRSGSAFGRKGPKTELNRTSPRLSQGRLCMYTKICLDQMSIIGQERGILNVYCSKTSPPSWSIGMFTFRQSRWCSWVVYMHILMA